MAGDGRWTLRWQRGARRRRGRRRGGAVRHSGWAGPGLCPGYGVLPPLRGRCLHIRPPLSWLVIISRHAHQSSYGTLCMTCLQAGHLRSAVRLTWTSAGHLQSVGHLKSSEHLQLVGHLKVLLHPRLIGHLQTFRHLKAPGHSRCIGHLYCVSLRTSTTLLDVSGDAKTMARNNGFTEAPHKFRQPH